ncbi:MAG: hypothetical protein JOY99_16120 [Sphingomonadaceae bacterium]|nr:hypothetical protein [Sphingomonadaceae bacterium]
MGWIVKARHGAKRFLKWHGEAIVYRVAGLPVLIGGLVSRSEATAAGELRALYLRHYFDPDLGNEWFDMAMALLLWPLVLFGGMALFTARNGRAIAARSGRSVPLQLWDQLRLYCRHGYLAPWYYIFSLHDAELRSAGPGFLQRFETKRCVYQRLARRLRPTTPLSDKDAFARHCAAHGLAATPTLLMAGGGSAAPALPERDLFVKPFRGNGGKGAQRWDWLSDGRYRRADGLILDSAGLAAHLAAISEGEAHIVQPRLRNHPAIADLSNGALQTVRALTCLDEHGEPELIGAVFRMGIGANGTVDNFHAGGIVSAIDPATGTLGPATDLGTSARIGWLDAHPDSGATIAGRALPLWRDVAELAIAAHRAFADRILIGWDIGITPEGVRLVEGNYAPDLDIMQRPQRRGLADSRLAELLAFHLLGRPTERSSESKHKSVDCRQKAALPDQSPLAI